MVCLRRFAPAVVAVVLLAASGVAIAETIVLIPVSGQGVSEAELGTTQELARRHLQERGLSVIVAAGARSTSEASGAQALAAATSAGASQAIVIHLARTSGSTLALASSYRVADQGARPIRQKRAVGGTEELESFLAEFAALLLSPGSPTAEPPAPPTGPSPGPGVSPPPGPASGPPTSPPPSPPASALSGSPSAEPGVEQRHQMAHGRESSYIGGLRVSSVFPVVRPASGNEAVLPGLGLYGLFDMGHFLAEISADFHVWSGEGDVSGGLGAYYAMQAEGLSPYAGGGIRYGFADYNDVRGASGASGFGELGVFLGRSSSAHLRLQVNFFVNLFEDGVVGVSERSAGFLVGLGFGYAK